MVAESLRILILEDNPADAELVQFELQDAGLAFTSKIVMTGEEYIQAIQDYCPDLILSDYDLPKYNGAMALAEARKRCPDTPFILVTGAVTEDRAIDILTQGAKDYVLKTRLQQRLVPAVKRALTEADEHRARKRAEEDLRKAHAELEAKVLERTKALEAEIEERKKAQEDRERLLREVQAEKDRLAALINSIQDEVWFAGQEKSLTLVNPAVERGFGTDALEGRQVERIAASYEFYRANGTPRTVEETPLLRALRGEVIRDEEEIVRTPATGELRHRQISAAPVQDATGVIIGSVCVVRDITERKAAEKSLQESEARLQFALKAARMTAWDYDPVTKKVSISRMADEVLALPPGQGLEDSDQGYSLIHPDDVEGHRILVTEAIRNAGSYISVYRQVRGGEVFWLEERGQSITDATGKTVRLVGVTQNITASKAAELELERAQDILTEAQRIAHLGSFEYVAATRTTVWSEEEYHIYGLDPAGPSPAYDVMLAKCVHPDDAALLHETFTKAMQSRTVYELEHRIIRPDGSVRWVYDRAHPYFDRQGNLLRYVGATLDVTERKKGEESLRTSEKQFKVLTENVESAVALIDESGAFSIVNSSFLGIFDIPPDATILNVNDRDWSQWQVFDERGTLLEVDEHPVRKAALTRTVVKNQLVAVKSPASQDLKWLLISAEPILDVKGEVQHLICTYYDITERKAAEDALKRSEQMFSMAFHKNTAPMLLARMEDGKVMDVNEEWLRLTGFQREEVVGKTAREHGVWKNLEEREEIISELMRNGSVRNRECRCLRKGGEEFSILFSAQIVSVHGESLMLSSAIDVSDRTAIEEALHQSKAYLQAVLDTTPDAIFLKDRDGRLLLANPATLAIIGKPAEAVIGKTDLDFYDDAASARSIMENDRRIMQSGEMEIIEETLRGAQGTGIYLSSKAPYRDSEGRVIGLIGMTRDITGRKRVEEALRQSESRLRRIAKAGRIGFFEWNASTDTAYWSPEHYELFGYELGSPVSWQRWLKGVHPEDRERTVESASRLLERSRSEGQVRGHKDQYRYVRDDGSVVWMETDLSVEMVGGEAIFSGSVRDISERKDVEIAMKCQAEQLEAANKELESFSYSVSHDLRAPLRAIDGYSRMILRKHADKLDEEMRGKFNVIMDNTRKMSQLIDDLLAFSRLGKTQLSVAKLDMGVMIREVWEEMRATNPERNLKLTIGAIPPAAGDRGLIRQVLVNLLSNAVKFTRQRPEALIEVGGHLKDPECIYTVRDNGAGFDMQYYDKMFGVFQRLHSAQDFEGTGVGLAIVQRIIHRHGGRVWAEGEVDKGATFYFTLPTQPE